MDIEKCIHRRFGGITCAEGAEPEDQVAKAANGFEIYFNYCTLIAAECLKKDTRLGRK